MFEATTASLQQTASNCQQNLQALGTLLQANIATGAASGASGGGSGPSGALVPWGKGAAKDGSGATTGEGFMAPWSVLPRYLKALEQVRVRLCCAALQLAQYLTALCCRRGAVACVA